MKRNSERTYTWDTEYLHLTYKETDPNKPKDDTLIPVRIEAVIDGEYHPGSWNPYDGGSPPEYPAVGITVFRASDGADITDWVDPKDIENWTDHALSLDDDDKEEYYDSEQRAYHRGEDD